MATKKKAPAKKAVKKTATKAAKKSAAKKAPAKKAAKPAAKKTAAKKVAAKKAASSGEKPVASDLLKGKKHDTPAVFKLPQRKGAPVLFTLEDVRELLKKRGNEKPKPVAKKAPVKKAVPAKKAVAPIEDVPPPVATKRAAASLADILGLGGGTAASPASPAARTVPRKWAKYHKLLTELRAEVHDGLTNLSKDTLKKSQKEDTGDLSTSVDSGSDNFDRDFALSLLSTEQEALREIDAAIERIYDGSYGVCEITGEAISAERLEAVPFTRFSLAGQLENERNPRRRKQQTGAFLSEGSGEGATFGDDDGNS